MNAGKMRGDNDSKATASAVLLVAMEMGLKTWRLALGVAGSNGQRQVTVTAGHYEELRSAVQQAKEKFGMAENSQAVFCYEAGRDGFYPYRTLKAQGQEAWVIDSSSIEVHRRARRVKNDAVDAAKILLLMQRQWRGEQALKIVRVPSVKQEDRRQRTREREELVIERGRVRMRMQSLLFAQGVRDFPGGIAKISRWLQQRGEGWPQQLLDRLQRELSRLKLVDDQLKEVSKQQLDDCAHATASDSVADPTAQRLMQLKGIGDTGASILSTELFGWRKFSNRREVAASVGLTPTPYDSGESSREQGISKAGNKRVRRVIVELAWKWLRFQPESALSLWFNERFGVGKRSRRIGIVALARKLLVSLWHYLEHGAIPQAAVLKTAA
jgi:transposase